MHTQVGTVRKRKETALPPESIADDGEDGECSDPAVLDAAAEDPRLVEGNFAAHETGTTITAHIGTSPFVRTACSTGAESVIIPSPMQGQVSAASPATRAATEPAAVHLSAEHSVGSELALNSAAMSESLQIAHTGEVTTKGHAAGEEARSSRQSGHCEDRAHKGVTEGTCTPTHLRLSQAFPVESVAVGAASVRGSMASNLSGQSPVSSQRTSLASVDFAVRTAEVETRPPAGTPTGAHSTAQGITSPAADFARYSGLIDPINNTATTAGARQQPPSRPASAAHEACTLQSSPLLPSHSWYGSSSASPSYRTSGIDQDKHSHQLGNLDALAVSQAATTATTMGPPTVASPPPQYTMAVLSSSPAGGDHGGVVQGKLGHASGADPGMAGGDRGSKGEVRNTILL